MITLAEAARNVGREVVYRNANVTEEGTITGVSEIAGLVYVRYSGDEWAKATHPSQLEFPETDDEAATPPVSPASAPAPTGGETTAVSATATAGPASSSSATGGRVTSEVATLPPVPQRKRGETDGYQEARLGLVTSHQEGQQVLGTCSPGATGSPEVAP